jgi:hypothetical protein
MLSSLHWLRNALRSALPLQRAFSLSLVIAILLIPANAAAGQSRKKKELPEPRPWSEGGILNNEVQAVGDPAMPRFAESFPGKEWLYLETVHCRIASSMGEQSLGKKDRVRMADELIELRLYFPTLPAVPKKLSAEMYLFLIGLRLEKLYTNVQQVFQVKDSDFPSSRAAQQGQGAYMGDGPYLGEREKFEFILHAKVKTHEEFTYQQRGLRVRDSVRWHNRSPSKLILSMPTEDSDIRQDRWMWPHLAHNAGHMMLDGYKFFAYDAPLWLAEGLALYLEKRIEPESWTREGGEGVFFERERSKEWAAEVMKIARKGKHTPVANLMRAMGPADLDRNAHLTAWSITEFLIKVHPEKYALLIGNLKAQLDEQGYPTGRNMLDLQRKQFKEIWDWTPRQMEEDWRMWASEPKPKAKGSSDE